MGVGGQDRKPGVGGADWSVSHYHSGLLVTESSFSSVYKETRSSFIYLVIRFQGGYLLSHRYCRLFFTPEVILGLVSPTTEPLSASGSEDRGVKGVPSFDD